MSSIETPAVPADPPRSKRLARSLAGLATVGLAVFIAYEGRIVYREFTALRANEAAARRGDVIGFENISPRFSYATKPVNWFHHEDEDTLLWAGWHQGKHEWFRFTRGDLTREQVSDPLGRDAVQAIDHPILELGGGARWDRMPEDEPVAGLSWKGTHAAYPMRVLKKVEVVNDRVAGIPLLVVFLPFVADAESTKVFDPVLDGKPLTMGSSGYFLGRKPLLYDRGTQSLWVERDGALLAITGPRKGATLPQVIRLEILPWSDWSARHPEGRLLVGADRSKAKPEL